MTPSSWYFCEQRVEHGAGLRAVLGEHVALADVLGPLAAGERRLVEGDVADQVERVEVLADLLGERLERQPFVFQFFDDRLLALGCLPALEEVVEAGEALLQRLLGVVAQALGDELAVLVEVLDALGDDRDARHHRRRSSRLSALAGRDRDVVAGIDDDLVVAGLRRIGSPSSVGGTSSGGVIGSSSPGS